LFERAKRVENFIIHSFYTAVVFMALCFVPSCTQGAKKDIPWHETARRQMVEQQIVARGIADTCVINAMLKVQRHRFVPQEYEKRAYSDGPLPIGEEQTISQPYVVAIMTEALSLEGGEKVLEIGTGSGYQAAVLSLIAKEVYSIELLSPLAASASARLESLGYRNVQVKCGDGFMGWPEAAPFDGIVITCAAPRVPEPLAEQLADGGRLVMPEGEDWQMLNIYKKMEGRLEKTEITPVRFVPMKGKIRE
jgi:protein-L-isoaspartate(D-aspartate) O-methyltransferase